MEIRGSNPALRLSEALVKELQGATSVMTIAGTILKSTVLLLMTMISASVTWYKLNTTDFFLTFNPGALLVLIFGMLVVAFIIVFFKKTAPFLAPVYALGEGVLIGTISWAFESFVHDIAIQATFSTFCVLAVMLFLYSQRLIRVTQKFRSVIVIATASIAFYYLLSLILSLFDVQLPLLHDSSIFGILFSLVVIVVASLNLLLDFDFIEQGSQAGLPKYMEWYAAFGLLVTVIWLYLEILRLLSYFSSRD